MWLPCLHQGLGSARRTTAIKGTRSTPKGISNFCIIYISVIDVISMIFSSLMWHCTIWPQIKSQYTNKIITTHSNLQNLNKISDKINQQCHRNTATHCVIHSIITSNVSIQNLYHMTKMHEHQKTNRYPGSYNLYWPTTVWNTTRHQLNNTPAFPSTLQIILTWCLKKSYPHWFLTGASEGIILIRLFDKWNFFFTK